MALIKCLERCPNHQNTSQALLAVRRIGGAVERAQRMAPISLVLKLYCSCVKLLLRSTKNGSRSSKRRRRSSKSSNVHRHHEPFALCLVCLLAKCLNAGTMFYACFVCFGALAVISRTQTPFCLQPRSSLMCCQRLRSIYTIIQIQQRFA